MRTRNACFYYTPHPASASALPANRSHALIVVSCYVVLSCSALGLVLEGWMQTCACVGGVHTSQGTCGEEGGVSEGDMYVQAPDTGGV